MRVRLSALCVSIVLVARPPVAYAQSAAKVIERYVDAIGGKQAVERIVSTDVSGRVDMTDGRSGAYTQRTRRPQSFFSSVSWGDSRLGVGFNGRAVWQDDTQSGLRTLYGQAASRVRADALYANTRFLLSENLVQFSVRGGRDQVRGRPVIVIVALTPDGITRSLSFDAGTGLLLKEEQQTDEGAEQRLFDDYRPVDQVMEPHRIEWRRSGETFLIKLDRVVHNAPSDGTAFDVPAQPGDRPSNIEAVLGAVSDREGQTQTIRTSYAYTQTWTGSRVDERGRLTARESRTFEVFHLDGKPVSKLLRRDGRDLSAAERRREDDRVMATVREYERRRASGQPGQGFLAPEASGSVLMAMPLVDVSWLPTFLRMSEFMNARREALRDRPAIAVEFQPKRGVAAASDQDRQAAATCGVLWVDQASQALVQIEAYLCDSFNKYVGGSSLRVQRTLVNGEVWLPFREEANMRRTFPLGVAATFVIAIQYSGHRKFTVETDSTVNLPR